MKNKKNGYLALAFLLVMIVGVLIKGFMFYHHFAITVGTVQGISFSGYKGSGDYSILFDYEVDGKTYRGNNNRNFCDRQNMAQIKDLLVGKKFPVAYGLESPFGGVMLFSQDYANRFNYKFNDSLREYDSILNCE